VEPEQSTHLGHAQTPNPQKLRVFSKYMGDGAHLSYLSYFISLVVIVNVIIFNFIFRLFIAKYRNTTGAGEIAQVAELLPSKCGDVVLPKIKNKMKYTQFIFAWLSCIPSLC
jgi:hypothetical protein